MLKEMLIKHGKKIVVGTVVVAVTGTLVTVVKRKFSNQEVEIEEVEIEEV